MIVFPMKGAPSFKKRLISLGRHTTPSSRRECKQKQYQPLQQQPQQQQQQQHSKQHPHPRPPPPHLSKWDHSKKTPTNDDPKSASECSPVEGDSFSSSLDTSSSCLSPALSYRGRSRPRPRRRGGRASRTASPTTAAEPAPAPTGPGAAPTTAPTTAPTVSSSIATGSSPPNHHHDDDYLPSRSSTASASSPSPSNAAGGFAVGDENDAPAIPSFVEHASPSPPRIAERGGPGPRPGGGGGPRRRGKLPPPPRASSLSERDRHDVDRISKAAEALDRAGNELFDRGLFDKAMNVYTKALKLKRRVLALANKDDEDFQDALIASIGTSINNIGYLRQRSGATSDETLAAYQDSLDIKREILGEASLSVGKTKNNIGSVHFSNKEYDQALESYLEALQIMQVKLGEDHLDVATVHSNIGDVYHAQGLTNEALQRYKEAMKLRWKLGEHNPKVVRLLEKVASIEMASVDIAYFKASLHEGFLYGDAAHGDNRMRGDDSDPELEDECHYLHDEVDDDISFIDNLEREMQAEFERDVWRMQNLEREAALDTLLDKLDHFRSTRHQRPPHTVNATTVVHDDDDGSAMQETSPPSSLFRAASPTPLGTSFSASFAHTESSSPRTTTALTPPLTPVDRQEALSDVKDRLARFRESRSREQSPITPSTAAGTQQQHQQHQLRLLRPPRPGVPHASLAPRVHNTDADDRHVVDPPGRASFQVPYFPHEEPAGTTKVSSPSSSAQHVPTLILRKDMSSDIEALRSFRPSSRRFGDAMEKAAF